MTASREATTRATSTDVGSRVNDKCQDLSVSPHPPVTAQIALCSLQIGLSPSPPNRGYLSASTPSPSGRRPGKVHKSSGCACGEFLPVPRTAIADTNTLLSGSEPRSEARCRYDVPSSVSLRRRKSIRPAGGTVLQPVHAVVWRGWRARAEAGDEDRSESCDSGP